MRFLYWNIRGNDVKKQIADLIHYHALDFIILSECKIPLAELLEEVNKEKHKVFTNCVSPIDDPLILSALPFSSVTNLHDGKGFSIKHVNAPLYIDFILVVLHLRSKLHAKEIDQFTDSTMVIDGLKKVEERIGHKRSIIVGDFNMDPFDSSLVSADAFNAVPCKQIAGKGHRRINNVKKFFFYNPMWNLLGDRDRPPGTYYYNSGKQENQYWHIIDQIILRPELLDRFNESDLEILTSANGTNFLSNQQIPRKTTISDHLPIKFSFNFIGYDR
jgi:exonuclease III